MINVLYNKSVIIEDENIVVEDIKALRRRVAESVLSEQNPEVLNRVKNMLESRSRIDIKTMKMVKHCATAGGRIGEYWKAVDKCKIYSVATITKALSTTADADWVYRRRKTAERRISGDNADVTPHSKVVGVTNALNILHERGLLPFKDKEGNDIPVFNVCIIPNAHKRIREMIQNIHKWKYRRL